jgi:steroid delta-isomerase-like uncharacterized protein
MALGLGAALTWGTPISFVAAQDATPGTPCPPTSEEAGEELALRWHEEAINEGDLAVIDELVSPDVVHHAGTFPDGVGPETIKTVLGALLTGFPDVQHTIEQMMSDDEHVVVRWQAEGTHEGEFQGLAPTGKRVTWTGINIFRVECGRIVESWAEVDGLGRLQQLGVVGTPAP